MSFAAGVVAYYYERITNKLVEHFKAKSAFSAETAIVPDVSTIADSLKVSEKEVATQMYRDGKFIKRVAGTNKWYLDESSFVKVKRIEKLFLLLLGFGVIVIIIYTLISLRNWGIL